MGIRVNLDSVLVMHLYDDHRLKIIKQYSRAKNLKLQKFESCTYTLYIFTFDYLNAIGYSIQMHKFPNSLESFILQFQSLTE